MILLNLTALTDRLSLFYVKIEKFVINFRWCVV